MMLVQHGSHSRPPGAETSQAPAVKSSQLPVAHVEEENSASHQCGLDVLPGIATRRHGCESYQTQSKASHG